jgi:quercetin dioxygenase-like cupin family protein
MRYTIAAALFLAIGGAASAQGTAPAHAAPQPDLKWGPAPAIFPAGAQMAVLQGDPGGASVFTVRLRFPDGYRIAPHTHPTDENVTVISGTFRVGMGEKVDPRGMLTLPAGGFVTAPANHPHYAAAQGVTVVQVHAMGPFAMTYVNPADTPTKAGASR